jgi:peptide/nickel transport system permease protein
MQRFIVRRVLQSLVVLVVLALVVFALARVTGNPADLLLPEDATRADREHLLKALGLDRPVHEQLGRFLVGALHGDLGNSIRYRKPAVEIFFERLPNTLALVPIALLGSVAVAIPLGLLAAVQGSYSMGGYPANLSYSGAPAPTGRGIMWIRRRR